MAKKQDIIIDKLVDGFEELNVSKKPKFVVNSIVYADGEESEESSDEEYDSFDRGLFDELNIRDRSTLPYRPYTIKISRAKKKLGEEVYSTPVGFVVGADVEAYDGVPAERYSTTVKPFLKELYKSGFESGSTSLIEDTVSASLLLNRPLSLSTRKNNLLTKELQAKTESPIIHNKFSVFWRFDWYDTNNKVVEYKTVRTFYKKLKRYDAENSTSKAEDFRSYCESGIAVPYQGLRELAKNHEKTKELVREARIDSPGSDVYLSIVDGDTVSFNGIYSAYLRIYGKADVVPTIMSTCYEFTQEKAADLPFVEGSKLCKKIRVATAKFVKLGIYITEPNVCILIPSERDTLAESFIDSTLKLGNAESAALMKNLIKSRGIDNLEVVISNDNPLLTAIPPRVRKTKSGKTQIKFSKEFESGLGPTEKDLVSFKQMSQSHVHEGVWLDNLYINRAFEISGNHYRFKGLLTRYLDESRGLTTSEKKELFEMVSKEDLARIKSAYLEKEKAIQIYKNENLRNADQQELIDFITAQGEYDIEDFDAEFLQILANADIVLLLKDGILDLGELSDIPYDVLKELLYDDEIISLLKDKHYDFGEVYSIYVEYVEDSDDGIGDFSFISLYELLRDNESGFKNLLFDLDISISQIISIYDEDSEAFYEISQDSAIAFLSKYGSDIGYEFLIKIYNENSELFYAMINDPRDILQDIGISDFIDKFEDAQREINEIPMDDPYRSDYEAYEFVRSALIEDGCPDEFLMGYNSEEWSDGY